MIPEESEPIILASTSPRRVDLLRQFGYRVEVHTAPVEEVAPPHFTVGEITLWNARLKAMAVASQFPHGVVVAADTLVAFEDEVLGKPRDRAEAATMLRRLNGQTHEVFSGVWLSRANGTRHFGFFETSRVRFRHLSEAEMAEYHTLINPLDKAGAYAAQEDPIGLIESIEGSRTNVIGLPMEHLRWALANFGA